MKVVRTVVAVVISLFASSLAQVSLAVSEASSAVVAVSGQATPSGDGVYSTFELPLLNASGQIAFNAGLTGTSAGNDAAGIFQGNSSASLSVIVRTGDSAPDGNGVYDSLFQIVQNESGQIAFMASYEATIAGSSDAAGINLFDGSSTQQIARSGQLGASGQEMVDLVNGPALNNSGQVAFYNYQDWKVLSLGTTSTLLDLARDGTEISNRNAQLFDIFEYGPSINDSGVVAFQSFSTPDLLGIYVADGTSVVEIALSDVYGTTLDFKWVNDPMINNQGAVAFKADGSDFTNGVYLSKAGAIEFVAGAGQPAPDGNGNMDVITDFALNDSNQIVLSSTLSGTSGGTSDDVGIYLASEGGLLPVAREGQLLPDGDGVFGELDSPSLNEQGQVAFVGTILGSSSGVFNDEGLFLFDEHMGLVQLARVGDELMGSTIVSLEMSSNSTYQKNLRSGLSDSGQVAYRFALADGRQGVAVASLVPEPSSVVLLTGILLGAFGWTRRRAM